MWNCFLYFMEAGRWEHFQCFFILVKRSHPSIWLYIRLNSSLLWEIIHINKRDQDRSAHLTGIIHTWSMLDYSRRPFRVYRSLNRLAKSCGTTSISYQEIRIGHCAPWPSCCIQRKEADEPYFTELLDSSLQNFLIQILICSQRDY